MLSRSRTGWAGPTRNWDADSVRSAYARIAENPRLGQLAKTLKNGVEVRRSIPWPFRNHQVIYLVLPDKIVIARVVHGAANYQSLLDAGFLEGLSEETA